MNISLTKARHTPTHNFKALEESNPPTGLKVDIDEQQRNLILRVRELDCEESWAPKNWCFWIVLEKTLESPLDCKKIQPVHPKDQSWVFIGRTDVEAETPILWPPDQKSWLIGKDPDAGKDWGQEETGMTEDEMVGWHHWLNRYEFGWTLGLVMDREAWECCCSWGRRVGHNRATKLNWITKYNLMSPQSSKVRCFCAFPFQNVLEK